MAKNAMQTQDEFWDEYEAKTGEKVLARSLGMYLFGWDEFDLRGWKSIWGLIIATSGGFRFHHFPQRGWFEAFNRNAKAQSDKTFFVPKEKIISSELIVENRWWRKIFGSPLPRLIVNYLDEANNEKKLFLDADFIHGDLSGSLNPKHTQA